ncbi:MAG: single-strand selective monofunctional uracil DNA glycosylase [Myxococcota bacterium]|jgi:single-strand selective monofunctional uracil DNA glycosylase
MLTTITDDLVADLAGLKFAEPVTHVYNPLVYARAAWDAYVSRYGAGPREVLLLGMNPGPFGMAQVGVPFGEIAAVRDWLGLHADVGKPPVEHPKRPILGFSSTRSEVSGRRLWGWAKDQYGTPEAFFERFFVVNYCPLVFMEASGRNRVPEKLPRAEREAVYAACDRALVRSVDAFSPKFVIGIGKFAAKKAAKVLAGREVTIASVPHPSPASPLANRGWAPLMDQGLSDAGVIV